MRLERAMRQPSIIHRMLLPACLCGRPIQYKREYIIYNAVNQPCFVHGIIAGLPEIIALKNRSNIFSALSLSIPSFDLSARNVATLLLIKVLIHIALCMRSTLNDNLYVHANVMTVFHLKQAAVTAAAFAAVYDPENAYKLAWRRVRDSVECEIHVAAGWRIAVRMQHAIVV